MGIKWSRWKHWTKWTIKLNIVYLVYFCPLAAQERELPEPQKEARVAILGESFSVEGNGSGISEVILGRLFTLIKQKKPAAIFFTGDLTLGLEKQPGLSSKTDENSISNSIPGAGMDVYQDTWPKEGYVYSNTEFAKSLDAFSALLNKKIGDRIPFYPLIGQHEAFGPDAAAIFKKHFKIHNVAPPAASELAYTVPINNAIFIVISTARYDEKTHKTILHHINPGLLNWLEDTLENVYKKYDFLFVIGNEPAFSTTASVGIYKGLDNNIVQREAFWNLLLKYRVSAYFCSLEHLYDRTNRYGIWQIISGGAGAPLYNREFDRAFYHYLLLTVPDNKLSLPRVQVFDAQGNLNDEFTLTPSHYPVYQLRISRG